LRLTESSILNNIGAIVNDNDIETIDLPRADSRSSQPNKTGERFAPGLLILLPSRTYENVSRIS